MTKKRQPDANMEHPPLTRLQRDCVTLLERGDADLGCRLSFGEDGAESSETFFITYAEELGPAHNIFYSPEANQWLPARFLLNPGPGLLVLQPSGTLEHVFAPYEGSVTKEILVRLPDEFVDYVAWYRNAAVNAILSESSAEVTLGEIFPVLDFAVREVNDGLSLLRLTDPDMPGRVPPELERAIFQRIRERHTLFASELRQHATLLRPLRANLPGAPPRRQSPQLITAGAISSSSLPQRVPLTHPVGSKARSSKSAHDGASCFVYPLEIGSKYVDVRAFEPGRKIGWDSGLFAWPSKARVSPLFAREFFGQTAEGRAAVAAIMGADGFAALSTILREHRLRIPEPLPVQTRKAMEWYVAREALQDACWKLPKRQTCPAGSF